MDNIKVLVVDDSPTIRQVLVSMLQDEPGFQVVGQAQDGIEAVQLAARLRPDVITMDIRMPRMDGLQATRQIMGSTPTPIVVVAASIYDEDLNIAFNAVAAGALTVVEKPKGITPADFEAVRSQLVTTIRLMADVPVVTIWPDRQRPAPVRTPEAEFELIAIAASTGGPGVLRQILSALPGDLSVPVVITQHITQGFVQGFANWLDGATELEVAVAQHQEQIAPGRALIAPDDVHMTVTADGTTMLDRSPPIKGLRPSATLLFESVARSYGHTAVGVVLTGMGEDGATGLEELHRAGGLVIAQDQESCVVFGMPKAAIDLGVVDHVLLPDEISAMLVQIDQRNRSKRAALPAQQGTLAQIE